MFLIFICRGTQKRVTMYVFMHNKKNIMWIHLIYVAIEYSWISEITLTADDITAIFEQSVIFMLAIWH